MEGKEPIKVKLSTVILLIIILILAGGMVYFVIQNNKLKKSKGDNTNQIEALQTQVKEAENKVTEIQESETNTIVNTNTNKDKSTNTSSVKDKYDEITKKIDLNEKEIFVVTDVEKNDGKYTLKGRIYTDYTLTKSEYDDAKNTGKITINGVKYTVNKDEEGEGLTLYAKKDYLEYHIGKDDNGKYVLTSSTQQAICYKATEIYKKIVVDENTKCVHTNYNGSIDEEEVLKDTTVKDYFKDFKNINENNLEPGELLPNYNFEFENGKCTKVTIRTIFI